MTAGIVEVVTLVGEGFTVEVETEAHGRLRHGWTFHDRRRASRLAWRIKQRALRVGSVQGAIRRQFWRVAA